jgi:threonine/homoserine/homoserine lactone efflux protein
MSLDLWLGFVLASSALLVIPGPTIMLVMVRTLAQGRRSALATVPGAALGDLAALSLSCAGLGAVLAASAAQFTVLKLAGAVYLLWLGPKMWQSQRVPRSHPRPLRPQLLVPIPTFVALAALNAALFALLAGGLRSSVQRRSLRHWLDQLGGTVLIAAGAWMLAWRRAG